MDLLKESENVVLFKAKYEDMTVGEVLFSYNISGRLFRRLKKEKSIYLNGKTVKTKEKVNSGDIVSIVMEDEIDNTLPQLYLCL